MADETSGTLDRVAALTGSRVHFRERIQTLWSGYGSIVRLELEDGPTVIAKHVRPPPTARATTSDIRKRRSYDVELAFYRDVAPHCDHNCRVAQMYANARDDDEWLFVLEDLDAAGYSARMTDSPLELERCLGWLAAFHARFMGMRIDALWEIGTYWHVATRRDELDAITDRKLRDRAEELAVVLDGAKFQTLLHGDAKEANFCFTPDRSAVAAVDFQYTGRGCGIRDVAYLLHGHGDAMLDVYFRALRSALAPHVDGAAVEAEWRVLYPIAQLDFQRFLAGWRG